MQEYLLLSQKEPRIEQYIRQPDRRWMLNEAVGLDKTIELPSLHISISLAEVFSNVEFVPTPIRPRADLAKRGIYEKGGDPS